MKDHKYAPFKVVLLKHDVCVGVLSLYIYGAAYPQKNEQIQIGDDIWFVDNVRHMIDKSIIHLFVSKIN